MTIYDYCAHKNPSGSAKVIASFGMQPVRDIDELAQQLAFCAKRNGGEVLRRIVLIHPDRALFEHERKEKEAKMLSAAGEDKTPPIIGGSDLDKEMIRLNAEKEADKLRQQKSESESKLLSQNNLIIGGVIVLGLALIMKK
tara:strand:+ start:972 stop:1394 length:423 start_codon:yes stop_codon:yes gene_type:complete